VHNPKAFLPGNRMAFAGLKDEDEIKDLIAYLKQEAGGS
jgi:cytochrome c